MSRTRRAACSPARTAPRRTARYPVRRSTTEVGAEGDGASVKDGRAFERPPGTRPVSRAPRSRVAEWPVQSDFPHGGEREHGELVVLVEARGDEVRAPPPFLAHAVDDERGPEDGLEVVDPHVRRRHPPARSRGI